MSSAMKHFVLNDGESVVGVSRMMLTNLQSDSSCDSCGKRMCLGTRVMGKVMKIEKSGLSSSRFSPTCLKCSNLN